MHKKNTKKIVYVKIFIIIFCIVFISIFTHWLTVNKAYARTQLTQAQSIKVDVDLTKTDPNYGTKEYWDEHFGPHDNLYLDEITPGQTIGNPFDISKPDLITYVFIRKDITVPKPTTLGTSGIIIDSNVVLIFERSEEYPNPTLTVTGADGKGSTPSGCGIDVLEYGEQWTIFGIMQYPISLTVKGVGKIVAKSGDVYDDPVERSGAKGNDGRHVGFLGRGWGGKGGDGGTGTAGVSAGIGTRGAIGGPGATETNSVFGDTKSEINGIEGKSGSNSPSSKVSGPITITGAISIEASCGVLFSPLQVTKSSGGDWASNPQLGWKDAAGAGGGGGSGGYSFAGCAIGTGGASGAGGGCGGLGGLDYDYAGLSAAAEIYALNGGGGGAGQGSFPEFTIGGGANYFTPDGDCSPAKDGNPSTVDGPGYGGEGMHMNGYDGDNCYGGKGGRGGYVTNASTPRTIFSSILEPREVDPEQKEGRNAAVEPYFPMDECRLDCDGGYIDPADGLHTYIYNEDDSFVPELISIHYPTGKNLGIVDKSLYDTKTSLDWKDDLYATVTATITLKSNPLNEPFELKYYVIKEAEIVVDSCNISVKKIYDGNIQFDETTEIEGDLVVTKPPLYEDIMDVVPEYTDFSTADVHRENKTLKLKVEWKTEKHIPCYLSTTEITVPYEITTLYTSVDDVIFEGREFIPDFKDVNISDISFTNDTDNHLQKNNDYLIKYSKISDDEDCSVGTHNVVYAIELHNPNVLFDNETKEYSGTSQFYVDYAHIQFNTAKTISRTYIENEHLVDIDASTAFFWYLPPGVNFLPNVDYKIYYENYHNKGYIQDEDVMPGIHQVKYKIELLNNNYAFRDNSRICDGYSDVTIYKKLIGINEEESFAFDRDYEYNQKNVDIKCIKFKGLDEGCELIEGVDYDIVASMIIDDNVNVGEHVVAYNVSLRDNPLYMFQYNEKNNTGYCHVNIFPRQVSVDSVECASRLYAENNFDVELSNVSFGNIGAEVPFYNNQDYCINSCKIIDANCKPGLHNVQYSISLLNDNYEFKGHKTTITGKTAVIIQEVPSLVNSNNSSGDIGSKDIAEQKFNEIISQSSESKVPDNAIYVLIVLVSTSVLCAVGVLLYKFKFIRRK